MTALLAALKALLPVIEPALAKEIDALLAQAESALDAKVTSPDLKLVEQCIMGAVQKIVDAELAKLGSLVS